MAKKKKRLSAESLNIKKTSMPSKGAARKKKIGKRHGMIFTHFVRDLFQMNEKLPHTNRMTDAEIARQIVLEYPDKKAKFDPESWEMRQEISKLRSAYNRGKLVAGDGPPNPKLISFQYNEKGLAVNPRYTIARPYTKEEIAEIRSGYEDAYQQFVKDRQLADQV